MCGGLCDGSVEDVVQDVMLVVWQKVVQFDLYWVEVSVWIYCIVCNCSIDFVWCRFLFEVDIIVVFDVVQVDVVQIFGFG